jgi:HAD superfamily hydrolase (TIGR01509 family)
MPGGILSYAPIDAAAVEVLLCDADGNLFPSEGLAFEASTIVTNRLLHDLGVDRRFEVDELRRAAEGRNFRSTALALAAEHGVELPPDELERRVQQEREEVTAHLGRELRPDPAVHEPLRALAERYRLAVVSSSALGRLAASFTAAGLDELFPVADRFSAEDSLPVPTSKPDPAVYTFAGRALGVAGAQAVAIEDAVVGARSAVAAGFPTVGNLQFVAPDERAARIDALREVGVAAIVHSWAQLHELLASPE